MVSIAGYGRQHRFRRQCSGDFLDNRSSKKDERSRSHENYLHTLGKSKSPGRNI